LEYSDYHAVAAAFGGRGFLLTASGADVTSDDDVIRGVFREAQEASRNGKAALINAWIGKTDFREGSISV
jgi:acetolactate synthase-like protein